MNDLSTHQKHPSKNLSHEHHKKKSIPISINSNPNPDQFLFKNNLSNIATSYKDISEKIQKLEKTKKLENSKGTNNTHMFNNFLSINSKTSQLSNQSSILKNASHIISQRILAAKNLSTTVFPKGLFIHGMNASKQKIAISNRNYLQAKTENNVLSNKETKKKNSHSKGHSAIKKNIVRQKSIGALPSSGKNLKIEYGCNEENKESNNFHKYSKVTVSNLDDRTIQINQIKNKISKLKYSFKKFVQIPKKAKRLIERTMEKFNTISSLNNPDCLCENDNNKATTLKKRGLSHDLQSKIKPSSAKPHINIQIKDLLPKNGRSISINQITVHPLKHTNHSRSKEKLINNTHHKEESVTSAVVDNNNNNNKHKNQQGKIPHQPIQVHIKPVLINNKKNQHTKTLSNHPSQKIQRLEVVEDYETERLISDHDYHNNDDHYNLFDYLLVTEEVEEEEDKFDDLNSIVRVIDFKSVDIKETNNFFNNKNELYQQFEHKYSNEFELSCSKNKISERKKMNMSLSTQENSYKKCLSPQFINEQIN